MNVNGGHTVNRAESGIVTVVSCFVVDKSSPIMKIIVKTESCDN